MGISSDGKLNYGIPFDEGTEFPWSNEDDDGEIEEWWVRVNNGPVRPDNVTSEDGRDWLPGGREKHKKYLDEKQAFLKDNPCPVTLEIYCSYDYPMYLITVENLSYRCCRGDAIPVKKHSNIEEIEAKTKIINFCNTYGIEMPCEPDWYLSSLYG